MTGPQVSAPLNPSQHQHCAVSGDAAAMIDAVADQLAQKLDDEYLAAARAAAEHEAAASSQSHCDSSGTSQPTANGTSVPQPSSNHERFVDQAIFR